MRTNWRGANQLNDAPGFGRFTRCWKGWFSHRTGKSWRIDWFKWGGRRKDNFWWKWEVQLWSGTFLESWVLIVLGFVLIHRRLLGLLGFALIRSWYLTVTSFSVSSKAEGWPFSLEFVSIKEMVGRGLSVLVLQMTSEIFVRFSGFIFLPLSRLLVWALSRLLSRLLV